jgi:hypothetical protein
MYPINLYGAGAQRLERDAAAAQREAKRRAKHEVDMLALEYAKVMMQKTIDDALNPATDARLRRDLRNDVMNRGIGKPPEVENPDKKKSEDQPASSILDFLAALSAGHAIAEASRRPQLGHTRDEPVERDITHASDADFEELLRDIEGEQL